MRVVHVINCLSVGGAERQLLRLAAAQRRSGDEAIIVTLLRKDALRESADRAGVPVTALGLHGALGLPRVLRSLRRTIDDFAPDAVQSWLYWANLATLLALGRNPARRRHALAWNIRQTLPDLAHERFAMRRALGLGARWSPRVDALVYNARSALEQHHSIGYRAKVEVVIPNAVETGEAPRGSDADGAPPGAPRGPESRRAAREFLRVDPGAAVVMHAARLHPMKDHAGLLSALAPLLERRPALVAILFGRGVTAEAMKEPIARHDALRLALERGRLRFMGEEPRFPTLLPAADLLVSSSAWGEGFPNVIAEAMAAEVPVVATDVGDSAELVGPCGRLVPAKNAAALRTAIEEILDLSHEERRALGSAARERVETRYSMDAALAAYHRLWRSIARGKE